MTKRLDRDDVEAAIVGGLLLSAGGSGGSGLGRNRAIGEMALTLSGVDLAGADELGDQALVMVASGIGAPASSRPRTEPRHAVESARRLAREIGGTVAAVMPAHVPGLNAWLVASELGIALLDAATNGRGHPTARLGSMGLAQQHDTSIIQVGVGGRRGESSLTVVAKGNFSATSEIMRAAAAANGGLVLASRGPITVDHIRRHGAVGALTTQFELGRAMLAAPRGTAAETAARFLRGEVLAEGRVISNSVAFDGAFDVGCVQIDGGEPVSLGVCNEYMTAERAGKRLYTFPDLIATIDPATGLGLEVSELVPGREAAVIVANRQGLPLGAGVLEAGAYEEIEQAMGTELRSYVLPNAANLEKGEERR